MFYADDSPIVRSTKQSLWPIYACILQIPPSHRYYQRNLLTLGLSSSRIKPDVDVFLRGILAHLETLIHYGTTISLSEQEYHFVVRIQGFLVDLPAKSLFSKTINFNGRFACTWCRSPGEYNTVYRVMLYPYEKNDDQLRTHDEFVQAPQTAAAAAAGTEVIGRETIIDGCESSTLIYGPAIELYSLHSHLHLADQVRHHDGLSYSSAYAFETCIRYTKGKAHDTRNLASQISYWTNIASIIKQTEASLEVPHGANEIFLESPILEEFREKLKEFI
ncbi:unnamed protein product [Rotaria magnacalcarata]|uniref:Uncharacterized protein n=3 Tax=Rotaria magnacalcarata TaxID=392030 RepID=A0A815FPD6_9BILA|nr:unnamed protein product [Rotaria magnacalcarata]CAF1326179.1 unnamed protein product [Rotaria magnacalcarata]CAF2051969.1 unnamed protein product [Rotaria magnacalcarata]CAF3940722.1 unnamed protein product [Rotaria magnacalcarata]